jgi:tetratricopeptide (TPR) repeat protein
MRSYRRGDMSSAEEDFRSAHQQFTEQGDPMQAAETANNLAVLLLQVDRPQEALRWVEGTPAVFEQQQDRARAAQAYGNLGSAQQAIGLTAEAEQSYLRSLDLFRELGDKEGQALILQRLSQVRLRQGLPLDALSAMQASLEASPRRGPVGRIVRSLLALPGRFLNR